MKDIKKIDLSKDVKAFLNKKIKSHYDIQEETLQWLVKHYPDHSNHNAVEVKAKLLNLFYSTGIQAMDKMVENIMKIEDIDEIFKRKTCSPELIHAIANIELSNNTIRDNYSFATKYCALHQPKKYPIYDSIVAAVLTYMMSHDLLLPYRLKKKYSEESTNTYMTKGEFELKLRSYPFFVNVYDTFMKEYGLKGKFTYRQVDWYIWGSFKDGTIKSEIEKLAPIDKSKYKEIF